MTAELKSLVCILEDRVKETCEFREDPEYPCQCAPHQHYRACMVAVGEFAQHAQTVLCCVSQIFNGWRDDPDWSRFDEDVAAWVVELQRCLDGLSGWTSPHTRATPDAMPAKDAATASAPERTDDV